MPPNIDLGAIRAARRSLAAAEANLTRLGVEIAAAQAERDRLVRHGVGAGAIASVDTRLAALQNRKAGLATELRGHAGAVRALSEAALVGLDPSLLVGTLDAGFPIALLPVRLETRFFANATELRIRIYPDQIHLDAHEQELTASERDAGRAYWERRWAAPGDATAAAEAWRKLAAAVGVARGAWAAHVLTPRNVDRIAADPAPDFPDPAPRAHAWTRPPRAAILPDRWVALGFVQGRSGFVEVFRVWGGYVPDTLNTGPSADPDAGVPDDDDTLPVDEGMRWVVDYDAAVAQGMAITVRNADLQGGRTLAQGVDRLLVLGVDWTRRPDEAAAALAELLESHLYSDGMDFAVPGTPTNNSTAGRAGYSRARDAALDPGLAPVIDPAHSACRLMARALGLPATGPLDRTTNAALAEQRTASLMVDALWESAPGYYLDELLDPLLDDAAIDRIRDHARQHLQPGGPLPALRIGRQPYGFLPVVAPQRFQPERASIIEAEMLPVLRQLRLYWEAGLADVPRLGASGDPDTDLMKVLQMTPHASTTRFRRVIGPELQGDTQGFGRFSSIQEDVLTYLVGWGALAWGNKPKLATFAVEPRDHRLPVPWVQPPAGQSDAAVADLPPSPNYVSAIATLAREGEASRSQLYQMTDGDTLLQAFLAHAALGELTYAESSKAQQSLLDTGAIAAMPARASLRFTERPGLEQVAAPQGGVRVTTPRQLSAVVLPNISGNLTLADLVAREIRDAVLVQLPHYRGLRRFLAALDELATRPVAELDRAFRGVLDCYGYRLDAWFTSLASRRLATLRVARPAGVHIGGYGWVDDLHPDSRPDSLGYLHTPSLAHGVAASILRSGHLSHRDDEHQALSIDLSSERVRTALAVVEGVAQGQPLAALLGYRFERGLRDRGVLFARFILPIRKLAPYRSTTPTVAAGPQESIAARDVVDGVGLLDRWRREGLALLNGLSFQNLAERQVVVEELERVAGVFDAASDLLLAEAVYQTALGNTERASAALGAIDRQERPLDPDVIRTPRTGLTYTQRLLVLLNEANMPPGWAAFPLDLRARAEPRLNAWIARLIGDPARVAFAGQVILPLGGDGSPPPPSDVSCTLADLGLSPLSLALATAGGSANKATELQERVAGSLARAFGGPAAEGAELVILGDPPPGADVGLAALQALLDWIRALISDRRFVDARDVTLPQELAAQGIDLAELTARADAAIAGLDGAIAALEAALAAPPPLDEARLRTALEGAAQAGSQGALPRFFPPGAVAADEVALHTLAAQAGAVLAERKAARKLATEIAASPATEVDEDDRQIARIKAVFGKSFPVLPLFTAPNAAELAASLADRAALTGGDELAPHGWLVQTAPVRPAADALASLLTGAELLGQPFELRVMQLPHAPGSRWAALPFGEGDPPPAQIALVAAGSFDPARPAAGLVVDAWNETIPAREETTGLSFHYDAPAARPPQAVLLAVTPDVSQQTWSFDDLVDTVQEAAALARLRAVGLEQIRILTGSLLPMVYLPQSFTKDVPSINLFELASKYVRSDMVKVLGRS